jgi:GPH family glycoside/pentoside/hexuronide:cation symporter
MSVVQLFYGVCYSCAQSLYADAAVYAQWKHGADSRGFIMGLQTVPLKVGVIGRSLILNIPLMMVGFSSKIDPAKATEPLKRGVSAAFSLVPGIILVVGFLLIFFGFRLTKEKITQYQSEIDARAKQGN